MQDIQASLPGSFPSTATVAAMRERRPSSLLRRVLWVALAVFLAVSAISALALQAVRTLQESSDTLLQVAIPLQRDILRIEALQQQAEFYLRLGALLPGQGYRKISSDLLQKEQEQLAGLLPQLDQHPQIAAVVRNMQAQLQNFSASEAKPLQQEQLDTGLQQLRALLQQLFQKEAARAALARQHATWLILALVFFSAILAILVTWRVKVSLSRPLATIRAALEDIASGKSAQVAEVGPPELRAIANSITLMQERLEEEEKLRHLFLSQISHELKTPLASARSGAELLLSERFGALDARQREILEIITRQMQELFIAIQEMLDLHALRARSLDYHIETLAPETLLHELERRFRSLLEQKKQRLQIACRSQRAVRADPQRLAQILSNLLTNAYKYAPAESLVELTVDAEGNEVHFAVRDYGKGIPESMLEKVFEEFFQVPEKGALSKGTGLGLPIARELVEAQGGRIRLRNVSPGLLAEFWLPAADSNA
ncbi:MAG: HAMP domain-containing sensor histidine kinase [Candidatus Igneacidithiobacillus chanchocoensis]